MSLPSSYIKIADMTHFEYFLTDHAEVLSDSTQKIMSHFIQYSSTALYQVSSNSDCV